MSRVYLDSCIVIYLIEGPEGLSRKIRLALQPPEGDRPSVYVSDLTRLECRVGPIRQADRELLRQFDLFFASRGVQTLSLDTSAFDLATKLRASYRTKTPDALHLATAMLGGCDEFWTNDRRLNAAAKGRIGIRIFS